MSRGPWFTAAFKTEAWRRWQGGENCADIARALGTYPGPLHRLLRQRGGVAHLRYRSARALSLSEREEISRGIQKYRQIYRREKPVASDRWRKILNALLFISSLDGWSDSPR